MTSWRDSTSQQAQDDFDVLYNASLEEAEHFLGKSREFHPFGVQVGDDDQVAMFAADPGLGEFPPATEVLKALAEGASADREGILAVALVADVSLAGGGDGVRMQLEHRDGAAIEIVVPYRIRRLGRRVTFEEMSVSAGEGRIWVD